MDLNTRQLRAFLAVADLASFSKAALLMEVAQPALSQSVRDLEKRLGLRLLDRTTRRVELTEAGRDFRRAARALLDDLERALGHAARASAGTSGRVVIAAPPLLSAAMVPHAMAEFSVSHPDVRLTLVDCGTEEIVEHIRSGRADCGLGTFPPAAQGLSRTRLARDALTAFLPAGPAERRKSLNWSELRDHRLITLTRDSGIRLLVEIGFEAADIRLAPVYEVAQITTALALVAAGLGTAVLPAYAGAAKTARNIVPLVLTVPTITRDIELIHADDRSLSPAAVAFSAVLRNHVRATELRASATAR